MRNIIIILLLLSGSVSAQNIDWPSVIDASSNKKPMAKVNGTTGLVFPGGVTNLRPLTPPAGTLRWNSDSLKHEYYTGSAWFTYGAGGGGGGSYTLPTASSTVLGGVKVGTGLAIDGSGILSVSGGGGGGGDVYLANANTFTNTNTFNEGINVASAKAVQYSTPSSTVKARNLTVPGVSAWYASSINASFNSGWILDDNTKYGGFFKLDARAGNEKIAFYRIPTGAGTHSDEAAMFDMSLLTGDATFYSAVTANSNLTAGGYVRAGTGGTNIQAWETVMGAGNTTGGIGISARQGSKAIFLYNDAATSNVQLSAYDFAGAAGVPFKIGGNSNIVSIYLPRFPDLAGTGTRPIGVNSTGDVVEVTATSAYAGEDVTIITASYTVPTTSKIVNIIFEGAATGQTITLPTGSGADKMVIYLRNNTAAAVNFSQSIWETSGTSGTAVSGQTTYKLIYSNTASKWYSIPLEVNN